MIELELTEDSSSYELEASDLVVWGSISGSLSNQTDLYNALNQKVDKVQGKGLSTNDYTNADKSKLDGVENGAEVNVQSDWNQTNTSADDYIKNKPTIPTLDNYYTKSETEQKISDHHDSTKQNTLVSGTNIKTINGQSVLGDGNIQIDGGVQSVNGQTGVVVLDAEDVGALPTGYHDSTKQDVISDLSTIRSGATLGTTSIQPNDNVSELTNDAGYLTQHQSLSNYYTKTQTDSAISDYHDSTKADASALTSHTSNTSNPHSVTKSQVGLGNVLNTAISVNGGGAEDVNLDHITINDGTGNKKYPVPQGTVTSVAVKMNGTTKGTVTDSGTIDLGTVITSHQSLSAYRTSSAQDVIDTGLSNRITTNSNDIDTIEAKIPTEATSSNKLADKDFVNSSISTNTAYFRGTSASGLSEAQFLAWANSLTKTNNDYVFWNTTDGSNVVYKRYKYNGTTWLFEYALNNSSFTSQQWGTINSGFTSTDKATFDNIGTTYATKSELTSGLSGKQNTLTLVKVPDEPDILYSIDGNTFGASTDSLGNPISGTYATKTELANGLSGKQNTISASNKLPYSYVSGTPTNVSTFTNDAGYLTLATLPIYDGSVI